MDPRLFVLLVVLATCQCKTNLSCAQIHAFVDGHNNRRGAIALGEIPGQPPASNMKLMVWDDELAEKAAKWASTNKFSHNSDRNLDSRRFHVGENIYLFSSSDANHKFDVDTALQSWFSEHKDFKFRPLDVSDFLGKGHVDIGHYTQMVWAKSMYLGCGISKYTSKGGKMHHVYVVCNYGPAGNIINQPPYESGDPTIIRCPHKDCNDRYGTKC